MRIHNLDNLEQLKEKGLQSLFPQRTKVVVGMATCGCASGAKEVFKAIQEEVNKRNLDFEVTSTGCLGLCQKEPIVDVIKPGWPRIIYAEMNEEKGREIVAALVDEQVVPQYILCKITEEANLVEDYVRKYPIDTLPKSIEEVPKYEEVPFFGKQEKRILRNCGLISPDKIEEYVAQGGYLALVTALSKLKADGIIDQVKRSGLRGRGGAGFPTGRKWNSCRQTNGDPKYIICNADEGDPGAYMDRSILEGNPHSVIEGMVIGAYAIGAKKGYIYVRAEYPLAIEKLKVALKQAEEYGFLGNNILGTDFNFSIDIERGSGAFVAGELSAMIASIQGSVAEPRQRPPGTTERGLWGRPTVTNNVKTWANIPLIIARGADWFSTLGTESSKGTVVFSLVGKVRNTGLVEVPMGTELGSLVFDIGGGIPDGRKLKAVQTGGPSGGCIPAHLAHLSADYETLTEAGSIMGSGGMVVMDEDTCMVDVAKYFLDFTRDESCGKCNPCREGTRRMLEILTDITDGRGQEGDIELLEEMGKTIIDSSLCGLGGSAPNPVLTTIRYFRDEYVEHIRYKRCPSIVCKKIIFTPCKYNCPVKTDVPAFIAHIARGEYREAFEVIRTPNPLPICCGFICHHPCEDRCRSLQTGGEAMSIKALKRFACEYVIKNGFKPLPKPDVPQLEKVAIVGSGPAGLAAAFDLARLGYQPTIFEASSVAGGNLALVIPEYRLPRLLMQLEIEHIKQAGVRILTNTPLGADLTLDDLFAQGYEAILLATGAHKSLKLGLPGEDTLGVIDALGFLEAIKAGEKVSLGEKVGVIGGGNSAIDAARTALRAGAKEVYLACLERREEMPGFEREIKEAIEEGIKLEVSWGPKTILRTNGKINGIELRRCVSVFDQEGKFNPRFEETETKCLDIDMIITAIGQTPDFSFLPPGYGLEISKRNTIVTDPETLATVRPGIFAAGEVVTGPSTIGDSIGTGKLAAVSINKFLRGEPMVREYTVTKSSPYVEPVERTGEELELRRFPMPCAPVAERVRNFGIVELGLTEEIALKEAKRCLRCDLAVIREEAVAEEASHG